jgi:hypothetical protein
MSTETDDQIVDDRDITAIASELTPIEQVEYLEAKAELEVERHKANLKRSRDLLKAHRATLKIMREGPQA